MTSRESRSKDMQLWVLIVAGMLAIPMLAQVRFARLDTALKKGPDRLVAAASPGAQKAGEARATVAAGANQAAPVHRHAHWTVMQNHVAAQPQQSAAFNADRAAASIDKRLSQLRAILCVAISRRMLTAYQVAAFNSRLDLLQANETRSKRVGLSGQNTAYLQNHINQVTNDINSQLAVNQTRRVAARPEVTPLSNLENQRLYLSARVTQGVRLGRLSGKQAKELRCQLDEVGGAESQAGGITPREQADLRRALAEIDARISRFM